MSEPFRPEAALEGLLFLAGEDGLSLVQLQQALPEFSREELAEAIEKLKQVYGPERGIELTSFAGRYKFVSRDWLDERAARLFETVKEGTLSGAALETLAVIAYRQPVTRVEIEEIRGVSCEAILKKLQARDLIAAGDRLDVPGKPLLYTVTDAFLDAFGLESLEDLPPLENRPAKGDLFERNE